MLDPSVCEGFPRYRAAAIFLPQANTVGGILRLTSGCGTADAFKDR